MHILAIRRQVNDRVPDDLPRSMIRYAAASVYLKYLDTKRSEHLCGRKHALLPRSPPKRKSRRMLEKHEVALSPLGDHLSLKLSLHRKRISIANAPEASYL
jgi:hypothetical protein